MGDSLQDISGIGESIASDLRSEFGDALCDASVNAITEVPYVSAAKAIHIKCCRCESSNPMPIIDETEPRLASCADTPERIVMTIVNQFDQRATGRTSDMKQLIQHSLAVTTLPMEAYRGAVNEHKDCLRTTAATRHHAAPATSSNTSPSERTRDRLLSRGKRQLKEDIQEFIRLFLDSEGPFSTKLDAIIAVRLVFDPVLPKPLPGYILADTIGCSSGYATEFEVVEVLGERVVLRKEHAARRQAQKTESWQRRAVLERDAHSCVRCDATDDLIIHHIVPVSQGGTDELDNLATLCEDCHTDAHPDAIDTPKVVYGADEFTEWVDQ